MFGKKHYKISLIILLLPFFLCASCNNDPQVVQSTEDPEGIDTSSPGSRNYVWTLDTLIMPMNSISCVWGYSPDDVWAVGAGGTDSDRLWHYDGTSWSPYKGICETGFSIYGFSRDNVWMCCRSGEIWHYNGKTWSFSYRHKIEGARGVSFLRILGRSPNDIYACGAVDFFEKDTFVGVLLHYDGRAWSEVYRGGDNSQYGLLKLTDKNVYLWSPSLPVGNESYETHRILEYDGKTMREVYCMSGKRFWLNIDNVANNVYCWINTNMYLLSNGKFYKKLSINDGYMGHEAFGRSLRDMFIISKNGLMHYNGTDMQYVFSYIPGLVGIRSSVVFDKDIFCALYGNYNCVLHGKLKE